MHAGSEISGALVVAAVALVLGRVGTPLPATTRPLAPASTFTRIIAAPHDDPGDDGDDGDDGGDDSSDDVTEG